MKIINKIKCKIFFHDLVVVNTYSMGTCQKVKCKRCGKYFGMNHDIRAFIPWDSELEYCMNLIGKE